MEDEESLQASALVGKLPQLVENKINHFLSNSVMPASIVVCGVFFASDQLLWMKELSVGASTDFIYNSWLQIHKNGSRDMFSSSSFAEKRVEGVVSSTDGLVARHLAIRLNSMFQAVQLPTSISNLNPGLANVDRDTLTHFEKLFVWRLFQK